MHGQRNQRSSCASAMYGVAVSRLKTDHLIAGHLRVSQRVEGGNLLSERLTVGGSVAARRPDKEGPATPQAAPGEDNRSAVRLVCLSPLEASMLDALSRIAAPSLFRLVHGFVRHVVRLECATCTPTAALGAPEHRNARREHGVPMQRYVGGMRAMRVAGRTSTWMSTVPTLSVT